MAFFRRKAPFRLMFFILLGLGGLALYYAIAVRQQRRQSLLQSMAASPAKADVPLEGIPASLLEEFLLLRPDEMALVPLVDGFQWSLGTSNMAAMYDTQPFGSPNPKRGGIHTGQDLNGLGGNDSNKGEPVYAAARGSGSSQPHPAEGIFPHYRVISVGDADGMKGKKRLFYVAVTRAEDQLYLSYTHYNRHGHDSRYCPPSRYLANLPEGLFELWETA